MVRNLLICLAVLVVMGPLRRPLLSVWRVVIPLAVGGIGGFVLVSRFMQGAPAWMMIAGPVFGAFMFGGAIMEGIDDILGPPRRDKDA